MLNSYYQHEYILAVTRSIVQLFTRLYECRSTGVVQPVSPYPYGYGLFMFYAVTGRDGGDSGGDGDTDRQVGHDVRNGCNRERLTRSALAFYILSRTYRLSIYGANINFFNVDYPHSIRTM
jgi:hypothetical protein